MEKTKKEIIAIFLIGSIVIFGCGCIDMDNIIPEPTPTPEPTYTLKIRAMFEDEVHSTGHEYSDLTEAEIGRKIEYFKQEGDHFFAYVYDSNGNLVDEGEFCIPKPTPTLSSTETPVSQWQAYDSGRFRLISWYFETEGWSSRDIFIGFKYETDTACNILKLITPDGSAITTYGHTFNLGDYPKGGNYYIVVGDEDKDIVHIEEFELNSSRIEILNCDSEWKYRIYEDDYKLKGITCRLQHYGDIPVTMSKPILYVNNVSQEVFSVYTSDKVFGQGQHFFPGETKTYIFSFNKAPPIITKLPVEIKIEWYDMTKTFIKEKIDIPKQTPLPLWSKEKPYVLEVTYLDGSNKKFVYDCLTWNEMDSILDQHKNTNIYLEYYVYNKGNCCEHDIENKPKPTPKPTPSPTLPVPNYWIRISVYINNETEARITESVIFEEDVDDFLEEVLEGIKKDIENNMDTVLEIDTTKRRGNTGISIVVEIKTKAYLEMCRSL